MTSFAGDQGHLLGTVAWITGYSSIGGSEHPSRAASGLCTSDIRELSHSDSDRNPLLRATPETVHLAATHDSGRMSVLIATCNFGVCGRWHAKCRPSHATLPVRNRIRKPVAPSADACEWKSCRSQGWPESLRFFNCTAGQAHSLQAEERR